MKYTRHIGYGILFGASVIMAANIDIQAEENNQTPIPVEEQAIVEDMAVEEPVMEETVDENTVTKEVDQEVEETETVSEPVFTNQQTEVNNGIPVIYLHIDESKGTIDAMNSDPKHNTYCYGTMDFILPSSDFKYTDLNTELQEYTDLDMQMRGRGNMTWRDDKKPYKIKLDKKTDLLGLGKDERNKHWVLLANANDSTLMKDRLTGYVGDKMGLEYTPLGVPVDVVMNDKYLGSYLLMEHVRVGTGRIDIDELDEADVNVPEITGGYVVQNGNQEDLKSPNFFTTSSGLKWFNHTPSFDVNDDGYENEAQKNYIRNYMQMMEDMLYSDAQTDNEGNSYTSYMDMPSAAKYWLVQAFSNNGDAMVTGSTYLYKKRDTESEAGKLYWGPLWDFDMAWGAFRQDDDGFRSANEGWIIPMLHDTGDGSFYQQIQKEWPTLKEILLNAIQDNGLIDKYYEETQLSAKQDIETNPPYVPTSYPQEVAKLKDWIRRRISWMDEAVPNINNYSRKVKVVDEGQTDIVYYVKDQSELVDLKAPTKEGYIFLGWLKEDGTEISSHTPVTSDMILTPKWLSIEEASKYEEVIFQQDVVNIPFEKDYIISSRYTAFPKNVQYKTILWESSNPSVATVNNEGEVTSLQVGTTTISAVLSDGSRWSYVLNLLEKTVTPKDIIVPETMTIALGEHRRIDVTAIPADSYIERISYNLQDVSILKLDYQSGTVTGKEIGTTTVEVYVNYVDPVSGEYLSLDKICTITVVEKKEEDTDDKPIDTISYEEGQSVVHRTTSSVQNQVKGVPTGVDTNIGFWLGSMMIGAVGIILSTYRRLLKK